MRLRLLWLCFLPLIALAEPMHQVGSVHRTEVDLGYETFGASSGAVPLIAVNGGPGLSHAYMVQNDIWQRAAAKRLVVLYDQRGTGASKRLAAGASQSMDAQVEDLEALRAALKIDPVALLGDSYGGLIVMAYAAKYPQHVAKLVLSDSPGPNWKSIVHLLPNVFPDEIERSTAEQNALKDPVAKAKASLVSHMRMIFYSPEKRDEYVSHMGDLGFEPAVGEAVQKATADLDLSSKLKGFRFPTLVISGRFDLNVAPETAWKLSHDIPGAKIVFFEKSGHLPAYEEPEKYLKVLSEFLLSP